MAEARKLATIMAVDVAGYSRAAESDDTAAAEAVARLRECLEEIIGPLGGRIFSTAGDGLMIELPSASAGVEAVMALLSECAVGAAPPVRVGLHLGDVLAAGQDLLGHGVNVAARLQALAEPGTAVVSKAVQAQLRGGDAAALTPQGRVQLDKMNERIDVYTIALGRRRGFARILWRRVRRGVVAAAVVLALGAGGYYGWRTLRTPAVAAIPVVAVLPFDARTPEAAALSREFSAALHEMLASPSVRLVSTASSQEGAAKSLQALREDLHADYALDGDISRTGDFVVVRAALIDVGTGMEIWRDRYEGDIERLEAVRTQINTRARTALQVAAQAQAQGRPVKPEALRLFLAAWAHNPIGEDVYASHAGAIDTYLRALEIQPDFATAWSDLSRVGAMYRYRAPTQEARSEAHAVGERAAQRVLALAPNDPFARAVQTQYADWVGEPEAFQRLVSRVIEVESVHPIALSLQAYELSRFGRAREALPIAVRARTLDAYSLYAFNAPDPVEYLDTPDQFEDMVRAQGASAFDPPAHWRAIHIGWLALGERERATRALEAFSEAIVPLERNSAQMSPPYAQKAARWLVENRALHAAVYGNQGARAAAAAEYQRIADVRPLGFRHDRTAVEFYNFVLPALALTGGREAAYAAWSARLERLPMPDGHWNADQPLELETFIFAETMFRPAFRPLRADARFWRMVMRLEFPEWWIADPRWPPDFCRAPDLGYDCAFALRYALDEAESR